MIYGAPPDQFSSKRSTEKEFYSVCSYFIVCIIILYCILLFYTTHYNFIQYTIFLYSIIGYCVLYTLDYLYLLAFKTDTTLLIFLTLFTLAIEAVK